MLFSHWTGFRGMVNISIKNVFSIGFVMCERDEFAG